MTGSLTAAVTKEILVFWRDPKSRAMVLGLPLIQLMIFGYAATLTVDNVAIGVIDEDNGYWSRELTARVVATDLVRAVVPLQSTAQLTTEIEQGRVLLALHYPADFSRKVTAGETAELQVLIDGRRANAGQVVASYLRDISGQLGIELVRRQPEYIEPPRAIVRHWFNANLNFRWFMIPSLAGSLPMFTAMLMTALSISRERELGTFDQLLVSPLSPWEIIVSKVIPALLGGTVVGWIAVALAILWFGIPFEGSLLLLFVGMVPFILSVVGVGLVISAVTRTQQQSVLGLFFLMIPIMLISGFATPVENMPIALQHLAQLSPLKHFLIVIQGSFLKAMTVADIVDNLWPLLVISAVTLPVAVFIVKRRLQ